MAYILNEVPTGAIDGSNKSYTTADTLYQLFYITVDGVIYTGNVSISGNVFTLADAPTASITVSYYTAPSSSTMVGTLTALSIRTIFGRYKKDISDISTSTFLDWCDWINKFAYRHILGIDPELFIEETTITSTVGQDWAYLPVNFRDVQRFGCGMTDYTNSERTSKFLAKTNPNSEETGYYVKGDKLYFTPTPTDAHAYMLRYTPTEPLIDDLTDTFIYPLDARYNQYIINALDVLYNQWDEEVGAESVADVRFSRLLDELSRNINQQSASYGLDDFTQSF